MLNRPFRPTRVSPRQYLAIILVVLLSGVPTIAGITVLRSNGITATGADGIQLVDTSGITATGADGILAFGTNGITATGADGSPLTGGDGITATGADGYTYTGATGITATGADSLLITQADGITATGADGITATGADGNTYHVDSITFAFPTGITATGADGITATGADGITATGADGRQIASANGITATGADGITVTGADGITATGADGQPLTIPITTLSLVGADLMVGANSHGISFSGADSIVETGVNALTSLISPLVPQTGLQSVDPELAVRLNQLTDDSNVNAVVVFHHYPTETDLANLQQIGIPGGTRFQALPMVMLTATKAQLINVSHLPSVRSIYGNRTLKLNSEPEVRAITGVERARQDVDLTAHNAGIPLSGRNVTVAVVDTGIDGTHPDLAGRVTRNIKFADTMGLGVGFSYPIRIENLPNTDLLGGHGSFVAGLIGGSGASSNGRYAGVAPNVNLVGLSVGDLTLLFVLDALDYLLANGASQNVRVVNCSFSANTVFDVNDPVNIATKLLTDNGINVVFSAGNTGPGKHTLNPYSVAPWVISVGATDTQGKLASFSSRGDFANALFRPTLVAPGVNVVSLRGSGVLNVTGAEGLANVDLQRLTPMELLRYTTSSGTSFSAPQVAGTIALMLEANPNLTPKAVRDILQSTATPLAPYYAHEVGAGMLNSHAAVLEAAFPDRPLGNWRGIVDQGQVRFGNDPITQFSGVVGPAGYYETTIQVPADTVIASIQIGWGPLTSLNDLGLYVYDSAGTLRAQSTTINLPGLTGKEERVMLTLPSAGTWRIRVRNSLGLLGTSQPFTGVVEFGRAQYGGVIDLASMSASLRSDVQQSLRSFSMRPIGSRFRPEFGVRRADLAEALVIGARVPQYLAAQATYLDVRDAFGRSVVESAQASPSGALFTDVTDGRFRPNDSATRLVAAVATVRAAGLISEAEANANTPLSFLDTGSIPANLRGYVYVAVTRGFLSADQYFRPQNPISRGELARTMAVMQNRAIQ